MPNQTCQSMDHATRMMGLDLARATHATRMMGWGGMGWAGRVKVRADLRAHAARVLALGGLGGHVNVRVVLRTQLIIHDSVIKTFERNKSLIVKASHFAPPANLL